MALSKSSYGQVKICRLYVDYMQYCKSIGYINNYQNMNIDGDDKAAWDYNPANMQTYQVNITSEADNYVGWKVYFKNNNKQFSQFMSTINYFGALGHDFGNVGADEVKIKLGALCCTDIDF